MLREARDREASDLHLQAGAVPFLRVEGQMVRLEHPQTPAEEVERVAREMCALAGAESGLDADFCFEEEGLGRFRVNLHHTARGTGLSVKLIPLAIATLEELDLPRALGDVTGYRTGMVLVTGPAGCGKSSTLAALVDMVNRSRDEHVVTIEDPIEFVFAPDRCNVTQRQVGPHTRSFAAALRAALREDPDVILVSELRDRDSIRTAIVAAETGHLVLGTLHTRDAASTVHRLLDVFPAEEQDQVRTMVAASLRTVVSQRLLPRAGGGRRVVAYEILHVTPAVANLIRDGRSHQIASQLQTGRRHGMVDLDTRLQDLLDRGLIAPEDARRHASNPKRFADGA